LNYLFFIFKAEVDDTLKRIEEHKGVQGYIIINNDGKIKNRILNEIFDIFLGIPIRSNLDTSLTQQYAALVKSLSDKARSTIREVDPTNELVFFRMRTKKNEILIAPGS
jgi:dynein light chain roadblock-type